MFEFVVITVVAIVSFLAGFFIQTEKCLREVMDEMMEDAELVIVKKQPGVK